MTRVSGELGPKRLELLRGLAPNAMMIALLVNQNNQLAESQTKDAQQAAHSLGLQIHVLMAGTASEIEPAFSRLAQVRASALLVANDSFFFAQRAEIVSLAAQHVIPGMYSRREYVTNGGLMSYGTPVVDSYRLVGLYSGRILHGEKPADLPVQQPTKYELAINLKTATALGLTVPTTLLATADEVIE
jgi:putative ABC transport system substrate-binding protein